MTPQTFLYPSPHSRRHGPEGYLEHESFRPWLRDEFSFRCVYCLVREQWWRVRSTFDIDHFKSVAVNPAEATRYSNLLYACTSCNSAKADQVVPDPLKTLVSEDVWVTEDGAIHARTDEARMLIDKLGLDGDEMREFRSLWIGLLSLAFTFDSDRYEQLMCYPDNLPDLSRLKPPGGNSRPEGIEQSFFSQRTRGELPRTY